jgi:hypothetical protein
VVSDLSNRIGCEVAMWILLGPHLRSPHVDDAGFGVESPPDAVRQQISFVAEWERLAKAAHDGVGLRQPVGVLTLMLIAELSDFLRPVFR